MSEKNVEIPYLTDDELEKLIMDIESEPLVQAPHGIERNVLATIDHWQQKKIVTFYQYCLRVGFAVAAAIALVCIVPFIPYTRAEISSKKDIVVERYVVSKDEVLESRAVKTKEEVLKKGPDGSYFEKTGAFIQTHLKDWFN